MKRILTIAAACAMMAMAPEAKAQIETPQPSPEATVMQKVGLSDVTVKYSRPSKKGRDIFGALVPLDQLWRTGANGSTDITFSQDIMFGGSEVKAGTYALYAVPGAAEWKVMLYSEADHWGTPRDFSEDKVVATAMAAPAVGGNTETFTIGFGNLTNNSAHLVMAWDNMTVEVPFSVDTKSVVQSSIDKVMSGPSANDYFSAASFYMEEGLDMEKAHMWISKAVEMRPEAFWMSRAKAEIEAKMGDYKQAIKTAKMSMEVAEKAGNQQYVGFNKANIAKWTKMK